MGNLSPLNELSEPDARAALLRCCGSTRWAEQMSSRRPFTNFDALVAAAREIWGHLDPADWLEAFAAHPRIGDLDSLRKKFGLTAAWAEQEQANVASTTEATLQALAAGNRAYEER